MTCLALDQRNTRCPTPLLSGAHAKKHARGLSIEPAQFLLRRTHQRSAEGGGEVATSERTGDGQEGSEGEVPLLPRGAPVPIFFPFYYSARSLATK